MSNLAKLTLKTYTKPAQVDPVQRRREKIGLAIDVQKQVLAAALKGETFTMSSKVEGKQPKVLRPWFIAQDGGYYIRCLYGARPLMLDAKSNAVFVQKLDEVASVLAALAAAASSGELDAAMASAVAKPAKKQG